MGVEHRISPRAHPRPGWVLALLLALATGFVEAQRAPPLSDAEAMAIHKRLMRGRQPGILLQQKFTTGSIFVELPARLHPIASSHALEELQWLFCGEAFAAVGQFGPASSHRADDDVRSSQSDNHAAA